MSHEVLNAAAAQTDRNPSDAQKSSGNYRKGKIKAHGLPVVIENASGSFRSGKDQDGKPWRVRMPCHYGYISRTTGADGDQLDIYIGPHLKSSRIFVLDQNDADTGKFDELKVFFGFASPRHVLATYRKAFSDGKADQRLGALTEMTVDQFKGWLKTGDTTKPLHRASGGRVPGMVEPGNIDLNARPVVHNPDGSISTVRSIGVNMDGREVLLPTVSPDGAVLSDADAVRLYRMSGKHLGVFDTPENSDAYARQLHEDQERLYARAAGGRVPDRRTKMGRDAFLYLDSTSGRFAQCGTCRFGHEHCAIMNGAKVDPENGSCGFYIKGAPIGHPIAKMTKAEVGYVDHPVRCENCRYFDAGKCGLYEELNREFPNQFDLDVDVHPHACCNAQMPRGRASGGRVGYAEGGDVVDLGGDGNFLTRLGEMEFSPGTTFGNRLFGTGDEERYQTWPEKMIRSGASLPGDVAAGKFDTQPAVPGQWSDEDEARRDLDQQELLARAQDTAGMAGGTAFGAADSSVASLGAGPVRRAGALPMDEASRMARAAEQGFEGPWYHGGLRMDRFTENGKIDPKRATSGPMPYFTDNPEMASAYAMGKKPDTSLVDEGRVADYFTIHPNDLGWASRTRIPVEDTWRFLSPEQRAEIAAKARRVGHENIDMAEGPLTLHPEGVNATGAGSHYDWVLNNEARGNHLAALRELWNDSGRFVDDPGQLSEIYRLAGYPHQISETTAPWTEARGVTPARIRMTNPLDTTNTQVMTERVLPRLEEMFKRDRSRKAEFGADMWDKNHRYTPKEWIERAKQDYASGENSYVWTSIPDKITNALRSLGYDGILDTGGKMGGMGHTVAIPFGPEQVRSQFARFDPKNLGKSGLLLEDASGPGAPLSALEKAPPFFSAVERAVGDIKQPKMTGDQWLGTLSNKPGVKAEELQWTGLADFLAERKGQSVTKQEIAEHLADNQVRLNEVWKGADPETLAKAQALAREHGWESWDALSPVDRQRYMQRVRGNRLTDEVPGDTKYHQYQLPGGENYREMLLTLPLKSQAEGAQAAAFARSMNEKYGDRWVSRMSPEEHARYDTLIDAQDAVDRTAAPYKSGHWDEPNIVAHMRMNDRAMNVPFTPEETAAIEARRAAQGQLDTIRAQQADVAREINATAKPLRDARRAQIMAEYRSGKVSGAETNKRLEQALYGEDLPELIPLQNRLQELRAQEDQLRASLPPEPSPKSLRALHLEEIQSDWGQQLRDQRAKISDAIDRDFDGIADAMVKAGVIKKVCD